MSAGFPSPPFRSLRIRRIAPPFFSAFRVLCSVHCTPSLLVRCTIPRLVHCTPLWPVPRTSSLSSGILHLALFNALHLSHLLGALHLPLCLVHCTSPFFSVHCTSLRRRSALHLPLPCGALRQLLCLFGRDAAASLPSSDRRIAPPDQATDAVRREDDLAHCASFCRASSSASAAMAAPSSSSSSPRLPSAEGPEAGECPSPSGGHSPASSGASPVSVMVITESCCRKGARAPLLSLPHPLKSPRRTFKGL